MQFAWSEISPTTICITYLYQKQIEGFFGDHKIYILIPTPYARI